MAIFSFAIHNKGILHTPSPANCSEDGWLLYVHHTGCTASWGDYPGEGRTFQKRVFYVFDHYDELWGMWLKKFKALGEEMAIDTSQPTRNTTARPSSIKW